MLGRMVEHVAALAKRGQVAGPVVRRVVVEMSARQDHPRHRQLRPRSQASQPGLAGFEQDGWRQPSHPPTLAAAPGFALLVPPRAIAQVHDRLTMWPTTTLTAALGTSKADQG